MDFKEYHFDMDAGKSFIYPTNYPKREYQYTIIKEALFKNTLVSLPTGLGKTFIAAVVMYNFYRWYPSCKIIFMAPTKPLVKQQIDACYNIMGIPKEATAEITGVKTSDKRKDIWKSKSVFFITPHVLQNDLDSEEYLAKQIRCLVIDEAHKARGNYAYCEVVKKIVEKNTHFRVLALSATPGNSVDTVIEIIKTLLIAHIEVRTRSSEDIIPYIHSTETETIVVPLGEKLNEIKEAYEKILEHYSRILIRNNVFSGNCRNLTKGRIIFISNNLKERHKQSKIKNYGEIMSCLNICITLYHGYELLVSHGLRSFCSFFKEHCEEKAYIRNIKNLQEILNYTETYLGPPPNIQPLPDATIPEISENVKFGHPKFYKLAEILSEHFNKKGETTKAIVFCEYRESVMEAYAILLKHRPQIKPRIFVGQKTITQRQQINTMNRFCSGECNTLIATSIAEEGLDIGEVDLIVCFDVHSKSPIRMIQRMGRTGRKGHGRVVFLVTEGKEQQILTESLIERHNVTDRIIKSTQLKENFYQNNPRMLPQSIEPKCQELHMAVEISTKTKAKVTNKLNQKGASKMKKGKVGQDIRDMFKSMPTSQKTRENTEMLPIILDDIISNEPELNEKNINKERNKIDEMDYLKGLDRNYIDKLLLEISNFVTTTTNNITNFYTESLHEDMDNKQSINLDWEIPDENIFENITAESLQQYSEQSILQTDDMHKEFFYDDFIYNSKHNLNSSIASNSVVENITKELLFFFKLNELQDIFSNDLNESYSSPNLDFREGSESPSTFTFTRSQKCKMKYNKSQDSYDDNVKNVLDFFKLISFNAIFEEDSLKSMNEQDEIINTSIVNEIDKAQKSKRLNFSMLKKKFTPKKSCNKMTKTDDDMMSPTSLINYISHNTNNVSNENINKISEAENSPKIIKTDKNTFKTPTKENIPKYSPRKKNVPKVIETICIDSDDDFEYSPFKPKINSSATKSNFKSPVNNTITSLSVKNASISQNKFLNNIQKEAIDLINTNNEKENILCPGEKQAKLNTISDENIFKCPSNKQHNVKSIFNDSDDDFEYTPTLKTQKIVNKNVFGNASTPINNITSYNQEQNLKLDINIDKEIKIQKSSVINSLQEFNGSSSDEDMFSKDFIEKQKAIEFSIKRDLKGKKVDNAGIRKTFSKLSTKSSSSVTASFSNEVNKNKTNLNDLIQFQESLTQQEINKILGTQKLSDDENSPIKNGGRNIAGPSISKTKLKTFSKKRLKHAEPAADFLDMEAEIDSEEIISSDEEANDSLESSFIDDEESQKSTHDTSEIYAHYLKTTKSPLQSKGTFKIPQLPNKKMNVFSQQESNLDDNTYCLDSFCVDIDDEILSQNTELSELEKAEEILRKRHKRKRNAQETKKKVKTRKRIKLLNSSDESD